MDKLQIQHSFIQFTIENNHFPKSIEDFSDYLEISTTEFYQYYSSLKDVDSDIWLQTFLETKQKLYETEVYPQYSGREKVLAFYYTWLEVLKENRNFILISARRKAFLDLKPYFLEELKNNFYVWLNDILLEGKETQEIYQRMFTEKIYPKAFWGLTLGVLKFWINDNSENFENTDIFVEKSVNFSFDAIGKTFLDSGIELGKFVFQRWFKF
ncbi:MAG: TetR/AcrR family transcriptional regulator [Bacteroidetes bacterium]|nr:MAG: TetR/AcrR family transcriptional regulator [Bacteroidota bacterium]TAG89944.1 MAG: TetR/AcrR family transcriptional regulator [Bacteroidota bacterium]